MSVLIEIRKRIKAIETIKKITHAMQLISMSTHAKLRTRERFSHDYQQQLGALYKKVKAHAPNWHNHIFFPSPTATQKSLVIIIGSQKGLVGNFNITTAALFNKHFFTSTVPGHAQVIVIGKKMIEHLVPSLEEKNVFILKTYADFSIKNFVTIATSIMHAIYNTEAPYTSVTIYSNQPKTFFIQKSLVTPLIPFVEDSSKELPFVDYYWQQPAETLIEPIAYHYTQARLEHLLFESLLAEHAARFLSMDSATRNASQLLDETTLQYNKLRQFKITKELTEIASGFQE